MGRIETDPRTDPRAKGGAVDAGSLLMQWARCRADLYAAADVASSVERDDEAPPWARRLARSVRLLSLSLLSLGGLVSAAAAWEGGPGRRLLRWLLSR